MKLDFITTIREKYELGEFCKNSIAPNIQSVRSFEVLKKNFHAFNTSQNFDTLTLKNFQRDEWSFFSKRGKRRRNQ